MGKHIKKPSRQEENTHSNVPERIQNTESKKKVVHVAASAFAGPLPPPNILEQYNKVIPSAAERIFQMAEKEGEHRRYIEKKLVDSQANQVNRGATFGFMLGVLALLGGFVLAYFDKSLVGIAAILGGLGAIITAFIAGSKKNKKKE